MGTFIAVPDTTPVAGYSRPRIGKLLDYVDAFAGFGLFRLRRLYDGPAVKVRRSSDNTMLDIGFTDNGELDETALLEFVGAGSGYAQAVYDQSGNGRHVTDAALIASGYTTAIQPRIVNAGAIERIGSRPCLNYLGAQLLSNSEGAAFMAMGGQVSIGLVQAAQQAATSRVIGITSSGGTNPHLDPLGLITGSQDGVWQFQSQDAAYSLRAPGVATGAPRVLTSVDTGTSVAMRVNGAQVAALETYERKNTGFPFSRFALGGTHSGPSNNTSARSLITGKIGAVIVLPKSEEDFVFIERRLAERAE